MWRLFPKPGCQPPRAGNGPCGGKTLVQYVPGLADPELQNSSNATEASGCSTDTPVQVNGNVPCKLRVCFCYPPRGQGEPAAGQAGSAITVTLDSIYRVKLAHAFVGRLAPDVHIRGRSTVRLNNAVDLARLGVTSISSC
jgi:hypothetical protein